MARDLKAPSTLLRRARARMMRAAALYDHAERELREARRLLTSHPDYERAKRAVAGQPYPWQHYTLPYWIERGIHATVNDADGGPFRWGVLSRLLRGDAKEGGAEANLARAQADERKEQTRLRKAVA